MCRLPGIQLTSRRPDSGDRAVFDAGEQRRAEIERSVRVLRCFDRFTKRQAGGKGGQPCVLAGTYSFDRDTARFAANQKPVTSGIKRNALVRRVIRLIRLPNAQKGTARVDE